MQSTRINVFVAGIASSSAEVSGVIAFAPLSWKSCETSYRDAVFGNSSISEPYSCSCRSLQSPPSVLPRRPEANPYTRAFCGEAGSELPRPCPLHHNHYHHHHLHSLLYTTRGDREDPKCSLRIGGKYNVGPARTPAALNRLFRKCWRKRDARCSLILEWGLYYMGITWSKNISFVDRENNRNFTL